MKTHEAQIDYGSPWPGAPWRWRVGERSGLARTLEEACDTAYSIVDPELMRYRYSERVYERLRAHPEDDER